MATNKDVKKAMEVYAGKHGLTIPAGFRAGTDLWGDGAQVLAWRVSGDLKKRGKLRQQSKDKTAELAAVLVPPPAKAKSYPIRHDYHAIHSSGIVPLSRKRLIVLHDMEGGTATGAAESTGSWFQNRASGGSTQYGVDNDSIQQYLSMAAIAWGAPYANTDGIHIEQFGFAHWSEKEWLAKAGPTLDRTAWLIAYISKITGIPVRTLSDSQVKGSTVEGITTHAQCTRVWHVYGGHTDPGSGYPLAYVLKLAKRYI